MADERRKSVRIDEELNKAINTLAGFHDLRADRVVAMAIDTLWRETFPGTPMPGDKPKGKRKR